MILNEIGEFVSLQMILYSVPLNSLTVCLMGHKVYLEKAKDRRFWTGIESCKRRVLMVILKYSISPTLMGWEYH